MGFFNSTILDSEKLAAKLKEGSPALFPTDTLPALAACPYFASKLWDLKKRPPNKPFILMGSSQDELFELIAPCALDDARLIAKQYWPGPLTMVLPASGKLVQALNPEGCSIGLRIPACSAARRLLAESGPLATTSANLSGYLPSLELEDVASSFPGIPVLGPLPWIKGSGLASSVISWQNKDCWDLVRRGSVIPDFLR